MFPVEAYDDIAKKYPECVVGKDHNKVRFIVISQCCDILHDPIEEPTIEILVVQKTEKDGAFIRGRHPRKYHMSIQEVDSNNGFWYEAKIIDRFNIDKFFCVNYKPCDKYSVQNEIGNVKKWIAYRYVRTAWPDEFESSRRSVKKEVDRWLKRAESEYLSSIYLHLDPCNELSSNKIDTEYVVYLLGTVTKEDYDSSDTVPLKFYDAKTKKEVSCVKTRKDIAEFILGRIAAELDSCQGIYVEGYECKSEEEVSFHEIKHYQRFTQYDYLSLGTGETDIT